MVPAPPSPSLTPSTPVDERFTDVDVLRNAEGLIAVISQRKNTGHLTFAIFKAYERNGAINKSSFVSEILARAYQELLALTIERMAKIRLENLAPLPVPPLQ